MKNILRTKPFIFLLFLAVLFVSSTVAVEAQGYNFIEGSTSYAVSNFQEEPIDDSGKTKLVWSLRLNKDNPEILKVKSTTGTDNNSILNGYYDGYVLTDCVKLSSLPEATISSTNTFKIQYSVDGVNFTDNVPTDLESVKAFTVLVDGKIPKDTKIVTSFSLAPVMSAIPDNKGIVAFDNYYKSSGGSLLKFGSFYLSPFTEKAANLDITYHDESGNELHSPQTISGKLGDVYDTTTPQYQLSIKDYELDTTRLPTNTTGILLSTPQTVDYIYTKKEVISSDVTAKYVDTDGEEISKEVVQSGNIGEDYTTEQKDITGYTFKEVQGNP